MSTKKSFFDLNENIAAAFCYILGPVTGLIGYMLEKENKTVRFHALQSIVFMGLLYVASFVISIIPIINLLHWIVRLAVVLCTLFLAFCAYTGHRFKIPMIGDAVEKSVGL